MIFKDPLGVFVCDVVGISVKGFGVPSVSQSLYPTFPHKSIPLSSFPSYLLSPDSPRAHVSITSTGFLFILLSLLFLSDFSTLYLLSLKMYYYIESTNGYYIAYIKRRPRVTIQLIFNNRRDKLFTRKIVIVLGFCKLYSYNVSSRNCV